MLILGIDPGLHSVGWGFVELRSNRNIKFVSCGHVNTCSKTSLSDKLLAIHQAVSKQIELYKPDHAAIEKTLVNAGPTASLSLSHAKGSLILTLALHGLMISEYCPTEIKKAVTGKGNADKLHISKMLQLMFQDVKFDSTHSADAVAIAVTHGLLARIIV